MKRFKNNISPDSREYPFKGGACKARKSVIIAPYTCLPDSNKYEYKLIDIRVISHCRAEEN